MDQLLISILLISLVQSVKSKKMVYFTTQLIILPIILILQMEINHLICCPELTETSFSEKILEIQHFSVSTCCNKSFKTTCNSDTVSDLFWQYHSHCEIFRESTELFFTFQIFL